MNNKEIIDLIHKAIYQFMDEYENDNGEEPLSEKDKLLLEVNKAICSKLRISQRDYEERPHGEWISNANGYKGINFGRKCSLCGKTVEFSENFCPKCGADMRGDNNE